MMLKFVVAFGCPHAIFNVSGTGWQFRWANRTIFILLFSGNELCSDNARTEAKCIKSDIKQW